MTVTTEDTIFSYTGNGVTTAFAFPRLFYSSSHLVVTVDGVTKTITTDYTVAGVGDQDGGTVTFGTAPAASTEVIIYRLVPYTQDTNFEDFDGSPADVTETQLDLIVMQTQQLNETVGRAILAPIGVDFATNTISGDIDATVRLVGVSTDGPSTVSLADVSGSLDAVFSGLAANDFIKYNGTNWINAPLYSGNNAFTGNNTFSGTTTLTGAVTINGTAAAQASIAMAEDTDNGTNKVTIRPPATLAADYTLTLPADDGTTGQTWVTDGSGTLTWSDLPAVATQANQETATSTTTYVSPGRQQYHPSAAKAWVNFNGTGTVAIRSSYNVSSITDNGTGDYTVNLTTAFSSVDYCVIPTASTSATNASPGPAAKVDVLAASSFRIRCAGDGTTSSTLVDAALVMAVAYGDQ